MLELEPPEPWRERVADVASIVRRGFPQFIGFEVLLRILAFSLFTPLTAGLTARLIAWSGSGAISNYDIASFFLSPKGLIYLVTIASIGGTILFFEFGGLVALAIGLQRERKITLLQLFKFLLAALPRLWRLAIKQILVFLLYAAPALAVTAGAYFFFLTKSDINYYLIAKPPAFWAALSIAVVAGLTFGFFALRRFIDWIYSVPLLLFTGVSPRRALRLSSHLVSGRRCEVLFMLLRCLAVFLTAWTAFVLAMIIFKWLLLWIAGDRVGLVLTMTAVLAVIHVIGVGAVGVIAMSTLGCSVGRRFLRTRPDVRLPDILSGKQPAIVGRVSKVLQTGWSLMVFLGGFAAFSAVQVVNTVTFGSSPTITAHRGSSVKAPENTIAAISQAVDEGADYIEIDVQETQDGTVVLVHDKDLMRVFGLEKGVWEVTYDELKHLDSGGWFSPAFSDQRLATLESVIQVVRGKAKLNIELKFNGRQQKLAAEVARIVKENNFSDDCIITSLSYAGLRRASMAAPEIPVGMIVTSALGDVTRLKADILSVSASAVTRDLVHRAQRNNLSIHVWTVNDIAGMNRMISMGVDSIITDDPALLRQVLNERALLSNAEKALLQLADIANQRF